LGVDIVDSTQLLFLYSPELFIEADLLKDLFGAVFLEYFVPFIYK